VRQSADAIGAVFTTQIGQNGTSFDYECTIIETNRSYDNDGEDFFGAGHFILEVAVQQVVYVTSDSDVDSGTVATIVETGFNRGLGGRVKFRSLLTELPVFGTTVDIQVLDGALSAPQSPPTAVPSTSPTDIASDVPSLLPSGDASLPPSQAPTLSLTPSTLPTKSSSGKTGSAPSKPETPVKPPTPSKPTVPSNPSPNTVQDDEAEEEPSFDRQPLIIAAIASGLATILVSCFFIFCVWYPFCWRKRDDSNAREEAPRHRRRRPSASSHSSGSTHAAEAMIPGVLHLDEDSRSLANTTVTQGTAKQVPSIYNKANLSAWKKRTGSSSEPVSILDSFDEGSVYTSTLASTASPDLYHSQDESNTIVLQSTVTVHDIVLGASKEDDGSISDAATDPFDLETRVEDDKDKPGSDSDSDPFLLEEQGDGEDEVEERSSSDSDPFEMDDNEDKSDEANIGVDSKDFDAYIGDAGDGDSSIGLTSLAISDSSFGPPMNESVGKVSISSTSTKTKRIDNLVAGKQSIPYDDVGWGEEQQRRLNSDSDEELLSSSSVIADSSATLPSSSVASAANNTLLRSILEDARLLSKKKGSSSRSVASGKSAPSRLARKHGISESRPKKSSSERQAPPLLDDLLVDNIELKEHEDPRRSPARSVGGTPRTTFGSSEKPTSFSHRTKYLDTDSMLSDKDKLSDRLELEYKRRPPLPSPPRNHSVMRDDPSLVTPSSSDLSSSMRGRETLGARPLDHGWGTTSGDKDVLVAPTSPPEMLGISKHVKPSHWLFEAEAPLGARPRTPSSRSAGWSTGSQSSIEENGERNYEIYRQYPSDPPAAISGENGHAGSHLGEQKTASDEMSPGSLENDLRRLERRLVEDIQSGDEYSRSTDGASTTLSSLITVEQVNTQRIIVVAPPGKLGVTLVDHHDGKGIVISDVRPHSSMKGKLAPGDKLVAVDDQDVSNMVVDQITSMMTSRSSQERRLTLLTTTTTSTVDRPSGTQETKQDGTP